MAKANPKAYFPGAIATISFNKVDAWARRQAKCYPEYKSYFETWELAHKWMLDRAMKRLPHATREAESARKHLEKVLSMREPEDPGKDGA